MSENADIWTQEEVDALNKHQKSALFHPYTCPGNNACPSRKLLATKAGWICACGEYTQNWAHGVPRLDKLEQSA